MSVGQPMARRIALRAIEPGRAGRTLLVHGPSGAGKGAFVDDLLAIAFCTDDDLARRPCNACRGCRDARSRSHPDLVTGSPEAWREQRTTGESIVAAARRWLLDAAGAPIAGDRRVVLVEHSDRSNEQIQNALLKALEEPTDRHIFILVADEPSRLLPTIRSRCQPIRIGPVPRSELIEHLMDVRRLPQDQAATLVTLANGLSGTAVGYADRSDLLDWRRRLHAELLDLLERGPADRLGAVRDLLDEASRIEAPAVSQEVSDDGEAVRTPASVQRAAATAIVEAWLGLTRDLMIAAVGRGDLAPSGELAPDIGRVGARIGVKSLATMVRLLERMHDGLRENASARLSLEAAMLAWPRLDA